MQIVNYKEKYKNDLDYLQIEQWGEGANIEDVGNNLDKYNARIAEEDDKLIGALVWHKEDEKTCFIDYIICDQIIKRKAMEQICSATFFLLLIKSNLIKLNVKPLMF